jgi:hypothetical protein
LGKFLLRQGRRPPTGVKAWTQAYLTWVTSAVHFAHGRQEATLLDYVHQSRSVGARSSGSRTRSTRPCKTAPVRTRAVIDGLQALRGIALVTAVTIVARWATSRDLPTAPAPGVQRRGRVGGIPAERGPSVARSRRRATAHLRRVMIEAAWATRHRPAMGATLRKRHAAVDAEVNAMAWTAQHRFHARFRASPRRANPQAGRDRGGP